MPRIRFRIRTILLFIAAIAVLMAIPQITAQLASIRWFWLEWEARAMVRDGADFGANNDSPAHDDHHWKLGQNRSPYATAASSATNCCRRKFVHGGRACFSEQAQESCEAPRERNSGTQPLILAWFHSCDSSDSWLNHFVLVGVQMKFFQVERTARHEEERIARILYSVSRQNPLARYPNVNVNPRASDAPSQPSYSHPPTRSALRITRNSRHTVIPSRALSFPRFRSATTSESAAFATA